MKYLVLIGDGMAGWPIKPLNKTTLELAKTPNIDIIAGSGKMGLVSNVPQGMVPGSDVANLSIFGYDPKVYYGGRAPIEAVSQQVNIKENEVVFRANIVSIKDGKMFDFTAGHIQNEVTKRIITLINTHLNKDLGIVFYAGVSYRNLAVIGINKTEMLQIQTTPPHDITGKEVEQYLPNNDFLKLIMTQCNKILADNGMGEYSIWLWGQGQKFSLPSFKEKYGLKGAVIAAVDLVKGLGMAAGLSYVSVPNITGFIDTNFVGKARYALEALKDNDIVFVHVEAPDEAGHMGDADLKVRAIELFDSEVLGTIIRENNFEDLAVLVLPDHSTPIEIMTHASEAVPFAMSRLVKGFTKVLKYSEKRAKDQNYNIVNGHELMKEFINAF